MVREINLLQTKLKADKNLSQTQINGYLDRIVDLRIIVNEKEGVLVDKERTLLELQAKYQGLLDFIENLEIPTDRVPTDTHDMGV